MSAFTAAAAYLLARDDFRILPHARPDGDTLGSAFALKYALQALGKRAVVLLAAPLTPKYAFLNEGAANEPAPAEDGGCVVAVDIADTSLIPSVFRALPVDICIDHHRSHTPFARDVELVRGDAACGELIYELIAALGAPLTPHIAECLFAAVSTDTGCFRFSNTTAQTHRVAAALLETGFDVDALMERIFLTKTRARLVVERAVAEDLRFFCGGRCAVTRVTGALIAESGATEDDLEDLASFPRQIEGVLAGILLRELADGSWKASLRSVAPVDVCAICARFGGGGHLRAAGCTLKAPYEEVVAALTGAVSEALADI